MQPSSIQQSFFPLRASAALVRAFFAFALLATAAARAGGDPREAAYQKLARDLNASLPTTVDQDTRLDSVTLLPGLILTYSFTVVTKKASQVNAAALTTVGRKQALAGACTHADTRRVLLDQLTMRYVYRGSDGAFITRFDVTPADCGLKR